MIDKRCNSLSQAVADIADGDIILVGGFGDSGVPMNLIDALIEQGAKDLTIVSNNAGSGDYGLAALLLAGQVRKVVCSYPRTSGSEVFAGLYREGKVELELTPQGTMAERLHAAGAGIGAFYTPTAAGTDLAAGKETRTIDGRDHVLEYPLHGDVALLKAEKADRWGNLVYRWAGRNFAPLMAAAAALTVVEVGTFVELGELHPQQVETPGIYVDRVVRVGDGP